MLFVTSGKDARAKLARSKSALDFLIANTRSLGRRAFQASISRRYSSILTQFATQKSSWQKLRQWIDTPVSKVDTTNLTLDADPKEARLYFQTMYELIYLSFLSDSTRVATFQLGQRKW